MIFTKIPLSFVSFRRIFSTSTYDMAKSKFEYVKKFELDDTCLPNCWILVRIDGKCFHRFSELHKFNRPNDERALSLMTKAANDVMKDFNDIIIAYGQSDEYSFVFRREAEIYQRRASKLLSNVVSLFASSYVFNWSKFFGNEPLLYPPAFDSRVVLLPTDKNLRDCLSWRQADCHINNLHNTCYWKLVLESSIAPSDAQAKLGKMFAKDKNEMLFSEYNTNYNNIPELFRKGTVIVKEPVKKDCPSPENDSTSTKSSTKPETTSDTNAADKVGKRPGKVRMGLSILHVDIIGDQFWKDRPHLLSETN